MGNQTTPNASSQSDEIDLGQLLILLRKGFDNIFKAFLRVFIYLKRNFIKLGILVLIGVILVFILNQFVPLRLKTEVILKPNFESKSYLYDAVEELDSKILTKDTLFFREMGINISELKGFRLSIEPIEEKSNKKSFADDMKFLELLQSFQGDGSVLDVARSEILNKSIQKHKLTFFYKNAALGEKNVPKMVSYLNTNKYFNELKEVYKANALLKIERNNKLISQIDELVTNYTKNLAENSPITSGTLVLDNQKSFDITGLLSLKNALVKEIERKNIDLIEQQDVINVINLGKSQEGSKSFFSKRIVTIPFYLIFGFFFISFLGYLNRKSNEL